MHKLSCAGDGAEYSIYELSDGEMIRLKTVQAADTQQFVSVADLEATTSPQIYVPLPSARSVPSPSRLLISGHQAERLSSLMPH